MNLTAWVDVAIGLMVVYLGASLFVTVINEYVAQTLNLRGRNLCKTVQSLISDMEAKKILGQSPALKPFFDSDPGKAPSYIDPNILAQLLVGGLATLSSGGSTTVEQVANTLEELPDSELKTQLQALVRTAGTTTDALVQSVSAWANSTLTMLGENYKRNLQKISFGIGFAVAVGLNLNTVTLTGHLYRDKDARDAAVALGVQVAEKTDKATFDKCMALKPQERAQETSCAPLMGLMDAVQRRNASLGTLPVGWPDPAARMAGTVSAQEGFDWLLWGIRLAGWLLTALALSLGAPFWFDILNKLVNVRYGMRRPE